MITNSIPAADRDSLPDAIEDFTADLLAAPRLNEPEINIEWVRKQMSPGGALGTFQAFHDNCAEADSFYLNEFDFSVPKGGTSVKLGTGHSVVNTLVSHVMPNFMDISVPPPGARGQARAERIEKFLTGAHHTMEQHTPTLRDTIKHQGLYGGRMFLNPRRTESRITNIETKSEEFWNVGLLTGLSAHQSQTHRTWSGITPTGQTPGGLLTFTKQRLRGYEQLSPMLKRTVSTAKA